MQSHRKVSVSDTQSLRKAHEGLTKAQNDQASAQGKVQSNSLASYYRDAIASGKAFTQNINTAIQRGLDPAIVSRLLQAGPKAAGPVLEQIVKDQSGKLVKLVNAGEQELARLNGIAVEQARITQLAISSSNGQLSLDFEKAQSIGLAFIQSNGKATAASIAKTLRIPEAEVVRIGTELGYTFSTAVQSYLDRTPVVVKATGQVVFTSKDGSARLGGSNKLVPGPGFASGGLVRGPGTATSDSIPALLSHLEYVLPARAVAYYGTDLLERMRRMQAPRFADGGLVTGTPGPVGPPLGWGAGVTGEPRVVTVLVPVSETHTEHAPIHIGKVVTRDADSFTKARSRGFGVWGVD